MLSVYFHAQIPHDRRNHRKRACTCRQTTTGRPYVRTERRVERKGPGQGHPAAKAHAVRAPRARRLLVSGLAGGAGRLLRCRVGFNAALCYLWTCTCARDCRGFIIFSSLAERPPFRSLNFAFFTLKTHNEKSLNTRAAAVFRPPLGRWDLLLS